MREDGEDGGLGGGVEGGRGGGGTGCRSQGGGSMCSGDLIRKQMQFFFFPLCTKATFPAHLTTRVLKWNTFARGDFAGYFSEL